MKKRRWQSALAVLFVVLAVLGTNEFGQHRERYLLDQCGRNLCKVYPQVNEFEAEHNGEYPTSMSQLDLDIRCPVSGKRYRIENGSHWREFAVFCGGSSHLPWSREPNFPRYGMFDPSGPSLSSHPASAMNSRNFEL